jgi:hypothetical protein
MSFGAIDARASLGANGSLVIEAYSGNSYNFKGAYLNKVSQEDENIYVTYTLGTSTSKQQVCSDNDDGTITFETGSGIGDGQIIITEYDAGINTVSGTFKFNAENSDNRGRFCIEFSTRCFYKSSYTRGNTN